jgi:hypothetical protein
LHKTRALILLSIFILVASSAVQAFAEDSEAWRIKGRLVGKNGKIATNVSGIACSTTQGFPRSCLLIDDNLQSAQIVTVRNGTIVAGGMIRLISNKYKGERFELDGEGVAYDDGFYYVMGSHGHPRDSKHSLDPISDADKIRAKIAASSQIVRVAERTTAVVVTEKLRAIIAADPVVSPFLDRRLENNGLTIEGVAVKGGRLFVGFRGPSLDNGRAAILSVTLGGLFGTEPADPKLFLLPLGNGQGVRDLASYAGGFLVLAGPAAAGGGNYAVYWWDGASESIRLLRDLADVAGKNRKAEALLPLDVSPSGLRALIFFDRQRQGAPIAIKMLPP